MVPWIGVDLDGTLAEYDPMVGTSAIGDPVPLMLARVKAWVAQGALVKVMTARAVDPSMVAQVEQWCLQHIGTILPVTDRKDFGMLELWDDRAIQVITNTGVKVGNQSSSLQHKRGAVMLARFSGGAAGTCGTAGRGTLTNGTGTCGLGHLRCRHTEGRYFRGGTSSIHDNRAVAICIFHAATCNRSPHHHSREASDATNTNTAGVVVN